MTAQPAETTAAQRLEDPHWTDTYPDPDAAYKAALEDPRSEA